MLHTSGSPPLAAQYSSQRCSTRQLQEVLAMGKKEQMATAFPERRKIQIQFFVSTSHIAAA